MGDINVVDLISNLVIYMVVLLLAISAHEAGHAWMSYKFGDDTAFQLGRVTLNPVKHTDPVGTLLIPMVSFVLGAVGGGMRIPLIGWGKPTPVNPNKWKNYKVANVMVSIAGILANLILAIIGFVILKSLLSFGVLTPETSDKGIYKIVVLFLWNLLFLNLSLAIFNLLPFPPLDGSKVLSTFLPASAQPILSVLEQYGFLILMALIYIGVINAIMLPVQAAVLYLLSL